VSLRWACPIAQGCAARWIGADRRAVGPASEKRIGTVDVAVWPRAGAAGARPSFRAIAAGSFIASEDP
jgi:hypothetical protein